MEQVVAAGKPVVLVLFDGRPTAIPWAATHVPTILEAWFPGIEAGPALVSVLTGEVSPSGQTTGGVPLQRGTGAALSGATAYGTASGRR